MKEIILLRGEVTLVDDDDYNILNQFKWYKHNNGYACRRNKNDTILMHRFIMKVLKGQQLDHIDRNKLNNQKNNLRFCNASLNAANQQKKDGCSSKYKGVCWEKRSKKWLATIQFQKKSYSIGLFENEIDAAIAYDIKAKELFLEFALLNFSFISQIDQERVLNILASKRKKITFYRGVSFRKNKNLRKPWIAQLYLSSKSYYLGSFNTEKDAAIAHDIKAKELFKENAILNFKSISENDYKRIYDIINTSFKSLCNSKYRGVTNNKKNADKPWRAAICFRQQREYLGNFFTEEEAAQAYNQRALYLFGEKAILNIISN